MKIKIEPIKGKFKKIFAYATWVFVILLLLSTIKNIGRVNNIRSQVKKEEIKVAKMEQENAILKDQIAQTQGSEFIDKQIRDKLGLSKEGETIVVLPDEDVVKSFAPPKSSQEESLPEPNWIKWKNLFF